MADEALFIGWGEVARGRERKALEVFNESLEYYGRLQQEGKVDSVETYFLAPHGGDLQGFILLRGDRAKLDEVEATAEFERIQTRAAMVVDRTGAVHAFTGDAVGRQVAHFQEAAPDIGS